ncbi:choice-of-anchor M domain-containing protein [Actinoplanes sp. RD1]|uniref:choice-of-anchor M domain-containing protein n=1 Tax=Actinoplanes sp. RD1 TaxID=3064538 RepID=UPI00274045DC|nr:choice-of-anchor M domain-containing protein [Actinoplanes sp. RD1]
MNLLAAVLATGLLLAPSPAPDQSLSPDQAVASGPAVLDSGHVDIGPRYRDGRWTVQIHDDGATPPVWRNPGEAVLRVRDTARQPVPDDDTYAFLGAQPGTRVYVVPQTQQPDVVWIGWNTQDPGVLDAIDRGVTMTLRGVQGPGPLHVYLQSGNLGAPEVLWDSTKPQAQPLWVETNTHTHANWVFGAPGSYLVAVDIAADLADGDAVTGSAVLRFAVGDNADPDAVRAEQFTAPLAAAASGSPAPVAADSSSGPSSWLLLGAALLVVAGILALVLRGAAARRRAEAERRP